MVLQEEPWLNVTTTCTLPEPWTRHRKQPQPNPDYIVLKWNISRMPQDYAGVYGHKGFGNLTVYIENNSSLFLLFGRFGKMHLQPISERKFSGYYVDKLWFFTGSDEHNVPIPMEFKVDQQTNVVTSVLFPVDFNGIPTLFQKNLDYDWKYGEREQTTSGSYCHSGISTGASGSNTDPYVELIFALWSLGYIVLQIGWNFFGDRSY